MIAININDKKVEKLLKKNFKDLKNINNYVKNLIIEDLEDQKFAKILEKSHKKDFVKKEEVFEILNKIS